jgi:hypothetical protein
MMVKLNYCFNKKNNSIEKKQCFIKNLISYIIHVYYKKTIVYYLKKINMKTKITLHTPTFTH